MKFRYSALVLVAFLFSERVLINSHVIKDDGISKKKDTSPQLNPEFVRQIKSDILKKLGLEEEPKIFHPKPPLQSLGSSLASRHNTKGLHSFAIFPEIDIQRRRREASIRLNFSFTSEIDFSNQVLYELWLFKNNTVDSFEVKSVFPDETCDRGFKIDHQKMYRGWVRFDASPLMKCTSSNNYVDIQISCEDKDVCPEDFISTNIDYRPFLIIFSSGEGQKRRRRKRNAVDCVRNSSTCCRERLYIPFESIGFDSWILEPEGYEANFCRGSCRNNIELLRFPHGNVIANFMKKNRTAAETLGMQISCVASKMSGLPFIHLNSNGIYVERNMPNMVVETCECS